MPTMGWASFRAPVEPKNPASPKAKIPPSRAANRYPLARRAAGRAGGVVVVVVAPLPGGVVVVVVVDAAVPEPTVMPASPPVTDAVAVSVAVIDCVPAVFRVTGKVLAPASPATK